MLCFIPSQWGLRLGNSSIHGMDRICSNLSALSTRGIYLFHLVTVNGAEGDLVATFRSHADLYPDATTGAFRGQSHQRTVTLERLTPNDPLVTVALGTFHLLNHWSLIIIVFECGTDR